MISLTQLAARVTSGLVVLSLLSACDDKPAPAPQKTKAPEPVEEAEPEVPRPKTAPSFSVDDVGPRVGFSRVMLTTTEGKWNQLGADQLKKELGEEKEFISGKDVLLTVHRKAKPEWVSVYLEELAPLGPSSIRIATETRGEYPKEVPFDAGSRAASAPACTLVGAITEDRGTALWRVEGGTARKRGRGMGGPDLTMTADTITSMAPSCQSDLFIVHGAEGVEWGLVYDLAASAMILEKAGLRRAALPSERPTPGHRVSLERKP